MGFRRLLGLVVFWGLSTFYRLLYLGGSLTERGGKSLGFGGLGVGGLGFRASGLGLRV